MVKKQTSWGGARKNAGGTRQGAGRPPNTRTLKEGQEVVLLQDANVSPPALRAFYTPEEETLFTVEVLKENTFRLISKSGRVITLMVL